jgi:hypothetical protein
MLLRLTSGLAAWAIAAAALGQVTGQDAIDRNLQERAVRERSLSLRLNESPPPPRPLAPAEITPPGVVLYAPGVELLERRPPPEIAPRAAVAHPAPLVPSRQQQLDESQRRRQLELQTRLPSAPVPVLPAEDIARQQSLQVQQLQFQREQAAERLGSEIMRNSERAMGR